ncbi:hypothetical protein P7D86_20890, partial [Enterococcus avium]|uniref:hypothetical protein n=1 Tax=Enterococcus avium TaxID=33945 RepID=UPI00288EEFB8
GIIDFMRFSLFFDASKWYNNNSSNNLQTAFSKSHKNAVFAPDKSRFCEPVKSEKREPLGANLIASILLK